jgi:hypothetical protein
MDTLLASKAIDGNTNNISSWFDNFVASIRADELLLETGLADEDKRSFWKAVIEDDMMEIGIRSREVGSKLIITKLLSNYITGINKRGIDLCSLSLQLSNSSILVWAIVNDDDDNSMDQLFLQEAETNAMFSDHGFHISTTIMEKSDNYSVPNQFQPVLNGKLC